MVLLRLRVRHSKGQANLEIDDSSTFMEFQMEIYKITQIPPRNQTLKFGFPPAALNVSDANLTLTDLHITSNEAFIVEGSPGPLEVPKDPVFNQISDSNQSPDQDGLIMVRRTIDADNTCLFNSVGYAIQQRSRRAGPELREIIAATVISDPITYNEAILDKSPEEYCQWIQLSTSWGGSIELHILSKLFDVQIAAVDIQTVRIDLYNQEADRRIYVIYDGIHYDVVVKNTGEEGPEENDITIFNPSDEASYSNALILANELRKKKQFTDVNRFALICGTCMEGFVGQREAVEHSKTTGHTNFQQTS